MSIEFDLESSEIRCLFVESLTNSLLSFCEDYEYPADYFYYLIDNLYFDFNMQNVAFIKNHVFNFSDLQIVQDCEYVWTKLILHCENDNCVVDILLVDSL